jgi:hypothetical protein
VRHRANAGSAPNQRPVVLSCATRLGLVRRRDFRELAPFRADLRHEIKVVEAEPLYLALNGLPLGEFEKERSASLKLGEHLIVCQKGIKTLCSHSEHIKLISCCAQGHYGCGPHLRPAKLALCDFHV